MYFNPAWTMYLKVYLDVVQLFYMFFDLSLVFSMFMC